MAIIGNLISRSLRIRKQFTVKLGTPRQYQLQVLHRLLEKAKNTQFGRHYKFQDILDSPNFMAQYRARIPVHNYNKMHGEWWHKCLEGDDNVSWPEKIKYFALSSGTSESASKHIPVTRDMLRTVKKVGVKQLYSMVNFNIPPKSFEKGILMLGGTTSLYEKGDYYEGDMSGIQAKNIPRWFRRFYKPGGRISKKPNWEQRIKLIVRKAPQWDVGTVCGVPAWVQIVLEEIIKYHGVKNIHEIWPNLAIYIHGGVSFEPYRESFQKVLGKPITFIETYMASEGSFGFQARPGTKGIKLVLNAGIFFEFIPFTEDNFDADGEVKPNPKSYMIHEVVEDVEYAVMLSTCAGAWRYLIGDVVKFTSVKEHEIIIVGRTKQFLSLCGEHMSIDNMNKAIDTVQRKLGITVKEFTIAGFPYENLFAHRWYIGTDDVHVDTNKVREIIDQTLAEVNDDYAVERTAALKEIFVEILPNDVFIEYLRGKGKEGAMNKFPRVMKGEKLKDWERFLQTRTVANGK
ncbi:GH3 auxin-responsive promoter family protein [Chitinophaga agrisoli]|uniref:GH3 auxin-responsive promoter family protein n=1 Tax=Chitinophaga agrisoli TaxID=2607653 RepID=A0A5B2W1R7_9BACT|nr:GH3 auxin-responsive promoter family protein [Chitinophaga agrisoli]KAA2245285.1 GH3 auxin-responsive promoter family protein [Chitinophaga agrisoli]